MIFMHKESGELFELLILSVDETGLVYYTDTPVYRIDKFTLYGDCVSQGDLISEFTNNFEFIGFL